MSHKATNWLSGLDASMLSASEFRVLFHLCDCHNPASGCFPTQAYLIKAAGVSNGTLNNALKSMEQRMLIKRSRRWDSKTKKQKETHYLLGFEIAKTAKPSPNTGDGKHAEPSPNTGDGKHLKPSPNTGDGPDSNLPPEPSPIYPPSRLQPTGDITCKQPVINQARAGAQEKKPLRAGLEIDRAADFWAAAIASGKQTFGGVSRAVAERILHRNLLTIDQLRAAGVDC